MSSTFVSIDPTQHSQNLPSGLLHEVAYANLYQLLQRAFALPRTMEEKDPDEWQNVITAIAPALQEAGRAVGHTWKTALKDRQKLSLAYARLFLGPFEIQAPPYASFYLESDQMLMGNVSRFVARAYVEAGLGPGPGPHEAPDHIALEWEYMYYVTYQYLSSGEQLWRERRRSFQSDHLDKWVPLLAETIIQSEAHPFYHTLALFLLALFNEP